MKKENKKALSKNRRTNQANAVARIEAENATLKKANQILDEAVQKLVKENEKLKAATVAVSVSDKPVVMA